MLIIVVYNYLCVAENVAMIARYWQNESRNRISKMDKNKKMNIFKMTRCAIFIAILAIVSQLMIPLPFSPVPMTLQTLGVLLCCIMLSPGEALVSTGIFILLGAVGLPIFSGFRGGPQALLGPTGGFLIGFIPMSGLGSFLLRRAPQVLSRKATASFWRVAALGIASLPMYIMGAAWFTYYMGCDFQKGLTLAVLPYLPLDVIKLVLAALVFAPVLQRIRIPVWINTVEEK